MGIWANFKRGFRSIGYGARQHAPFFDYPHEPLIVGKNQEEFNLFFERLVRTWGIPLQDLSSAMQNYLLFLTGFKGKTIQFRIGDKDFTFYNKVIETVGYGLKEILDHDVVNNVLINNRMARHTPYLYPNQNVGKSVAGGRQYTNIKNLDTEWGMMISIFDLYPELALNAYQNVLSFWESTGLIIEGDHKHKDAAQKFVTEIAEGMHPDLPFAINRAAEHSIPLIDAHLGSSSSALRALGESILQACLVSLERIKYETIDAQGAQNEAISHYDRNIESLTALEQKYGHKVGDEYVIYNTLLTNDAINQIRKDYRDSHKTLGDKIADLFSAVGGACWRFCKGCGRAIASPFIYIANKVRGNNKFKENHKEPVYGYSGSEYQSLDVNYRSVDFDRREEGRLLSDYGASSGGSQKIPSYDEWKAQGAPDFNNPKKTERDQSSKLEESDSVAHKMHSKDQLPGSGID